MRPNAKGGSFVWGAGDFGFDATFTQHWPEFADGTGNGVAALLLGTPTSGQLQYTPALAFHWQYYAGYVQDDFRINETADC